MRPSRALLGAVVAAALLPAGGLGSRAQTDQPILAGAAAENVTPFTVIPGVTTRLDPRSDPAASNPDGLPGGLWHTFHGLPEAGLQVTPSGVWGEAFEDTNGNNRWDDGEPFTDDPVNSRYDPDSTGKYDGVFMAGFGSDRIAIGAYDPLWARALYLRDPDTGLSIAHVAVDFLGWFSDWNDRIVGLVQRVWWPRVWAERHPDQPVPPLDLDHLVVSHTHNHEGPDMHVGIWGAGDPVFGAPVTDGTYPRYERYVEFKVAQAVAEAAAAAVPAAFRFGSIRPGRSFRTLNGNTEDLAGMQSRNSCRTPWVFDDELRAMQVVAADGSGTIATLVNWGTHVESLEGGNVFLSSDFVHAVRQTVETALGGMAFYTPGAQGAVEIVGDSCTARWTRKTYDGETFQDERGRFVYTKERTYAIGRVVGSAALAALQGRPLDPTATGIELVGPLDLYVPVNNEGLGALGVLGVIDKKAYLGNAGRGDPVEAEVSAGAALSDLLGTYASPFSGVDVKTAVYAWRIGRADFLTAPGELFPEIYWGLATHNRGLDPAAMDHADYVSPNPGHAACAARPFAYDPDPARAGANTGRPFEPGIREAQERRWPQNEVHFLLGYTPDLLGYIVPGYDFAWYAAPPVHGVGLGAVVGEAPDPCRDVPPDLAFPGARYGNHYHETNSAGSMLAPGYACTVWQLLGLDPATSREGGKACEEWRAWKNGVVVHAGAYTDVPQPSEDPEDTFTRYTVRHY